MRRLIISTLVSAALFAAAIAMQRSPSIELSARIDAVLAGAGDLHSGRHR
jgi:hypothetical protein